MLKLSLGTIMIQHPSPIWKAIVAVLFCFFPIEYGLAEDGPCVQSDNPITLGVPNAQDSSWAHVRDLISQGKLEIANQLIGSAPSTAEGLLWKGVLLLQRHQTFDSIRALEDSARIADGSAVETLLATDYLLLNQRILAQEALDQAMKLNSEDPQALYVLGRLRLIENDVAGARNGFMAVLKHYPREYHCLYYLGLCEWRLGDNAEAKGFFVRGLDELMCRRANFPSLALDLSQLELQLGEAPDALKHSNMAVQIASQQKSNDQQLANILLVRGKVYLALGRRSEAEIDWQRAVSLSTTLAEGWYLLARSYQARGDTTLAANAIAEFRKIKDDL